MIELQSVFSEKQRQKLTRHSPTPLYFQLYKMLKTSILNGTFQFGMRLPTEKQLSGEFDISRITVKRSLDELAAEGLVERWRGKGTYIIYKYKPKPVHAPLVGMLQEIESMALNSPAITQDCELLQPPQDIRQEFNMQPGEKALYLVRIRERNNLRFAYYVSWTVGVDKPARASIFNKTPRLKYFRENGLVISHVKQTISAEGASPEAAEALGVEEGTPLLSLTRRSYKQDKQGEKLIDFMRILYHPERFQYRMDLTLDQ